MILGDWLYQLLARLFGLRNVTEEHHLDVVIPLSYGLAGGRGEERLCGATESVFRAALALSQKNTATLLATRVFYPLDEGRERELKRRLAPGVSLAFTSAIDNTFGEVEAVRKGIGDEQLEHLSIGVVCEAMHSRRARLIWRKMLPNTRLTFFPVYQGSWPHDHVCLLARSRWVWFLTNAVACLLIKAGVNISQLRHPTSWRRSF